MRACFIVLQLRSDSC